MADYNEFGNLNFGAAGNNDQDQQDNQGLQQNAAPQVAAGAIPAMSFAAAD